MRHLIGLISIIVMTTKKQALALFGDRVTNLAAAVGVTSSAVSMWPEVLTPVLRDRVQAALWRRSGHGSEGQLATRTRNKAIRAS